MVTPEKYEVKGSIQEPAIILTSGAEPKMQVTITLTSPVIREEGPRDGGWKGCRPTLLLLLLPLFLLSFRPSMRLSLLFSPLSFFIFPLFLKNYYYDLFRYSLFVFGLHLSMSAGRNPYCSDCQGTRSLFDLQSS